jgi:RNA-directed DNA polymerase
MLYGCILGWVIVMDLEEFFVKVNHDKFMGILAKYIKGKSVA